MKGLIKSGLVALLGLSIVACKREPLEVKTRSVSSTPIDQVFMDHNGYRTYHTNSMEALTEVSFVSLHPLFLESVKDCVFVSDISEFKGKPGQVSVRIFKDLSQGERGYAKTLIFSCNPKKYTKWQRDLDAIYSYTEIHLPRNKDISPGIDAICEGKHTRYSPMGEIK